MGNIMNSKPVSFVVDVAENEYKRFNENRDRGRKELIHDKAKNKISLIEKELEVKRDEVRKLQEKEKLLKSNNELLMNNHE